MNTNTRLQMCGNRVDDIHSNAPKPVERGDSQDAVGLQPVKKPRKLRPAFHCQASGDYSGDDAARQTAARFSSSSLSVVCSPLETRSHVDIRAIALGTSEIAEIDFIAQLHRRARNPKREAANCSIKTSASMARSSKIVSGAWTHSTSILSI